MGMIKQNEDEFQTAHLNQQRMQLSPHYQKGKVDVWKFGEENFSLDENVGFHRLNAIKYLTRYGAKEGFNVRDLEKAQVEIRKLIELHNRRQK
ncbi:DUF3310 domain-containing protein [Ureibacillus chungkukjangi]|uniref:DUF3310 domain-containing protein n=1 Tax=Ureibacillus chungkukjangi TaxID=1202712 RepID=UPI00384A9B31